MTTRTNATTAMLGTLARTMLVTLVVGCGSNQVSIGEQNPDASAGGSTGSGARCGGLSGCPRDQFCDYGGCFSTSDNSGTCLVVPHKCPTNYAPVCGCDGKTYGNDCERQVAGVSKASDEPCDGTGGTSGSGGISGKGSVGGSGAAGATSTGASVTGGASLLGGSSGGGKTGGSSGTAGAGGSSAARCGGIAGLKCATGYFCDYGSCSIVVSDAMGTCVPRPDACVQNVVPVCGCDGKTYSNDCMRMMAEVGKASDTACNGTGGSGGTGGKTATGGTGGTATGGTTGSSSSTGKICGGIAGLPCGSGEYCDYPAGTCGSSDVTGICVNNSGIGGCTTEFAMVCGCDGKNYGNACELRRAGVSKRFNGECLTMPDSGVSDAASSNAALCTATGGTIKTQTCCASATDFPNSCLVGACGCDPATGHDITVCNCPTGCFVPGEGCFKCTTDQSCNNDPTISMLHGKCGSNGRCSCNTGYNILANGRCQ